MYKCYCHEIENTFWCKCLHCQKQKQNTSQDSAAVLMGHLQIFFSDFFVFKQSEFLLDTFEEEYFTYNFWGEEVGERGRDEINVFTLSLSLPESKKQAFSICLPHL